MRSGSCIWLGVLVTGMWFACVVAAAAEEPATPDHTEAAAQPPSESTPETATPPAEAAVEKPPRKASRAKYAAVDLSEVDGDFALQGEYVGYSLRRRETIFGLQVVALGDGRFDAALLPGGLPGDGWDGVTRYELTGQRSGDWVTLEGDGYRAEVSFETARLGDTQGVHLAALHKVRRVSPREGAPPPPAALVLFDGTSVEAFAKGNMTSDGLLKAGALTGLAVQDFHLHLEFRTPYMPYARDQGRANSGVYIQQRYEVQILDSFGLRGEPNQCGGLYRQQSPDLNMCYPPLSWQTYDIHFQAARWDSRGNKLRNARITVVHNGQPVHWNYSIPTKTGAGKAEGPEAMPILLQDHGNPVLFRNVWIELYEPAPQRVVSRAGVSATRFPRLAHCRRLLSGRRCR